IRPAPASARNMLAPGPRVGAPSATARVAATPTHTNRVSAPLVSESRPHLFLPSPPLRGEGRGTDRGEPRFMVRLPPPGQARPRGLPIPGAAVHNNRAAGRAGPAPFQEGRVMNMHHAAGLWLLGLACGLPAPTVSPEVNDQGKFFSAEAVK